MQQILKNLLLTKHFPIWQVVFRSRKLCNGIVFPVLEYLHVTGILTTNWEKRECGISGREYLLQ